MEGTTPIEYVTARDEHYKYALAHEGIKLQWQVTEVMYSLGRILEEDYKKFLLDTTGEYTPPLIKE